MTRPRPLGGRFMVHTQEWSVLHLCNKFEADCSILSSVMTGSKNFEIWSIAPGHAHSRVVLWSRPMWRYWKNSSTINIVKKISRYSIYRHTDLLNALITRRHLFTRNKHTCSKHPAIGNMRFHIIFYALQDAVFSFSPETVIYPSRVSRGPSFMSVSNLK